MRVFGAAILIVAGAACGPAQTTPVGMTGSAIGNEAARGAPSGMSPGDYACRIRDGGYDYPPFRCVVRAEGGRNVLEKIEGSVRFRGVLASSNDGFSFKGELYCPWGDCTEPVRAEFRPTGDGVYVALVQPADTRRDQMEITIEPSHARAGGAGYGGYGYGYGGYGYGGGY